MNKIVISASITPLMEDGSLDKAGFRNLLDRNIRHGLDGIFIFGTMGEWYSFDEQFKEEAVAFAADHVKNRTELMVGITSTSRALSLKLMESYKKYDFGAFVYMLPQKPSAQDPLKSVLEILDHSDRPVYFYYSPHLSSASLSLKEFAEILKHPNLKGIKNSSCNMWLRKELLLMREENGYQVRFLEGQEWSIDEAALIDLDGAVCGIGGLASKMLVTLIAAFNRGDIATAKETQKKLIRLYHGIYGENIDCVWTGQKYALYKMGIISSPFTYAQEMDSLSDAAKKRIEACIATFKDDLD
ncbi:MAG: dihydrodipicolinate synthase family protein [Lentisphaeria bacterium]|nr:dihydrodipicolinate synthase family protein [Lentisphaeria bacterium]